MIRWTKTLEITNCKTCPFFCKGGIDDYCNLPDTNVINDINIIPDFCPLEKNNFLIHLKPKLKKKIK